MCTAEMSNVPLVSRPEAPAVGTLPGLTLFISSSGCWFWSFIITFNKLVNTRKSLSSVCCSKKLIKPEERRGHWNLLFILFGHLGFWLASEWSWGRENSLLELSSHCGIWHYLQVDNVWIELTCRTPNWCHRELLVIGEKTHIFDDQKCKR